MQGSVHITPNFTRGLPLARRVIGWQVLICAVCAGLALGLSGPRAALAAVFGGVAAMAPAGYAAATLFRRGAKASPEAAVGAFYRAEIGKFALTGVLFFFGVALFAGDFLALLLTYMACLASYWVVMALPRE